MCGRIRALIVKEFRALLQDRRMRLVLIVPPLLQLVLFANAATFEIAGVSLGIWDEDGSRPAAELIDRFARSPAFDLTAVYDQPEEVAAGITEQHVTAVLHLGQRFSADLLSGQAADLQLIIDARRSNTAMIVGSYAQSIIDGYTQDLATLARRPGGVAVVSRAWFNPNLSSRWFILPGLVVLLSFVTVVLTTALSVARERELGTFDQLLVTPMRPMEIVIGKTVPTFAIGVSEAALLVAVVVVAYGVPFVGSAALLVLSLAIFLLSGIGIGLAISSVAKTQQQAILGVFLFLAPAMILSGFATPVENMPGWCRALTLLDPIRYMLVVARGVFLQDMAWDVAAGQIWPMAAIGLATLITATWLFRGRLE
ncbi:MULTISPECIES: ABC transporter permease [unclassified Inquilinus]|uniref:ABC transporter permease n=1 Tax=unclassified Inquilinus TaxID=2645927 RepID=UPI003F932B97